MNAKEFLIATDQNISNAVVNGYDIRLTEPDLLTIMELYAEYKLNNLLKPDVSGRSEQLLDFCYWLNSNRINDVKDNLDIEEVEEYLKSSNCH